MYMYMCKLGRTKYTSLYMEDIVQELNAYEKLLEMHWQNHKDVEKKRKVVLDKIESIVQSLQTFDDVYRNTFVHEHDVVLYKLYDVFTGTTAKLYNTHENITIHRSAIDKLFGILKIKPKSHFSYLPTRVFNQFIKGITYFEDENPVESPFYHREASCESKAVHIDAKFSKPDSLDSLQKCYIERLIYDKLYSYFLHEQEVRHLKELIVVERYFQQHFQYITIHVNIQYDIDSYPYKCIVTTYDEKNDVLTLETYTKKPWNRPTVMCEKKVVNKGKVAFFSKITSYQQDTHWSSIKTRASN